MELNHERLGGQCVVDSAFAKQKNPFLIESAQDPLSATDGDPRVLLQIRQAMSEQQDSEWGMRAFKGSFSSMKIIRRVSIFWEGPGRLCAIDREEVTRVTKGSHDESPSGRASQKALFKQIKGGFAIPDSISCDIGCRSALCDRHSEVLIVGRRITTK